MPKKGLGCNIFFMYNKMPKKVKQSKQTTAGKGQGFNSIGTITTGQKKIFSKPIHVSNPGGRVFR